MYIWSVYMYVLLLGNLKLHMQLTLFFYWTILPYKTWNLEFSQAKRKLFLVMQTFCGIKYFSLSISIKINLQYTFFLVLIHKAICYILKLMNQRMSFYLYLNSILELRIINREQFRHVSKCNSLIPCSGPNSWICTIIFTLYIFPNLDDNC